MIEDNKTKNNTERLLSGMSVAQMQVFSDNKNSMLMEIYQAYLFEKNAKNE